MSNLCVPPSDGLNYPNVVLNILCRQKRGLKICHLNAQSLLPKVDEFQDLFNSSFLDLICISETWLGSHVRDELLTLQNFKLYRNDRVGRVGGGVCIYVRDSIRARIIAKSDPNSATEYLFIEILANGEKCLVGTVYKPPDTSDLSTLDTILSQVSHSYSHIIITGDFNIDLLRHNACTRNFTDLTQTFGLSIVNSAPTHFTSTSSTLLDLLIVANPDLVVLFNQISLPAFSKHDLIFCTYDISVNTHCSQTFSYRDFENIDHESLFAEAVLQDWTSIYYLATADEQLNHLTELINYFFIRYVPIKTRRILNKSCPWFTLNIRRLVTLRNSAYRRWKRFRTSECWNNFRILRNKTSLEVRRSKSNYYSSKFNVKLPTKTLWNNLKSIGVSQTSCGSFSADPNELNRIFTSSTPTNINSSDTIPEFLRSWDYCEGFSFKAVTQAEVYTALRSVKSNAVGLDDIHPKFISILTPVLLPFLTHFFNTILLTSVFPHTWKLSKIIPTPKKSSSTEEYRPISILPFLSKVFEKLIHHQLLTYLDSNNLLSPYQSGFRPKHSCTTALTKISDDIRISIDNDNLTILVLLDFSKAFDKIDHKLLLHKLIELFNFSSPACKLIWSYLTGRHQKVYCGVSSSDFLPVPTGVPQGSILGPLLFSIFINDLPLVVRNCNLHLYADDTQLYISRPLGLVEDAICRINDDLDSVFRWAERNVLLLNASKSDAIVIYKSLLDTSSFPPVTLNNSVIPFSNSVRNLGVIFNRTLNWSDHINSVVGKIYGTLRKLSISAPFTPRNTRILLVKTLIVPIITYGCEVFCKLDSRSSQKLNVAFNSAVRYVYGLRRFDHVSSYTKSILGCSLESYLNFRRIMFLRNIFVTKQPNYLFNKLNCVPSIRSFSLSPPVFHSRVTEQQFFIQSVRLWNALPLHIRRSSGGRNFACILLDYFRSL